MLTTTFWARDSAACLRRCMLYEISRPSHSIHPNPLSLYVETSCLRCDFSSQLTRLRWHTHTHTFQKIFEHKHTNTSRWIYIGFQLAIDCRAKLRKRKCLVIERMAMIRQVISNSATCMLATSSTLRNKSKCSAFTHMFNRMNELIGSSGLSQTGNGINKCETHQLHIQKIQTHTRASECQRYIDQLSQLRYILSFLMWISPNSLRNLKCSATVLRNQNKKAFQSAVAEVNNVAFLRHWILEMIK